MSSIAVTRRRCDTPHIHFELRFQRGVPVHTHAIVKVCEAASHPPIESPTQVGHFWNCALCCGDLKSVQLLYRVHLLPEFAGDEANLGITNLPMHAASSGRLDVLQWLHCNDSIAPAPWDGSILNEVLTYLERHEEVAHWLVANRPDACAADVSRSVVRALQVKDLPLFRALIAAYPNAVADGILYWREPQLDLLRYLHSHTQARFSAFAMNIASHCGQLDVLQFLHEHHMGGCTKQAMDSAAFNGHLCTKCAMNFAASHGHLPIVQYLHANRTEGCTTDAMDEASAHGHLHIVQFLHSNRTEGCTATAVLDAAANGHLHVVQFLRENRTEGSSLYAMCRAARNGHLDVVRFLYENRVEEEESPAIAVNLAACTGHLEVVKFFVEKQMLESPKSLMNSFLARHNTTVVRVLHESLSLLFDEESLEIARNSSYEDVYAYVAGHLPAGLTIGARTESHCPVCNGETATSIE